MGVVECEWGEERMGVMGEREMENVMKNEEVKVKV